MTDFLDIQRQTKGDHHGPPFPNLYLSMNSVKLPLNSDDQRATKPEYWTVESDLKIRWIILPDAFTLTSF